jgi:nucleoside phosphorylase/Mg-chelatase subunit ChlD
VTDSSLVVILTALRVEYEAVLRHLPRVERRVHPSGTLFKCGRLPGTGWTVALAQIGEGNDTAAVVTEQAHSWLKPKALLFVGIAGALKDDVQIGDVVIADYTHAYQGAKDEQGTSYARPRGGRASWRLLQAARVTDYGPEVPRFHLKPIAAGDVVLNDRRSSLRTQLEENYNDAVAIEMESAGVARAAHIIQHLDTLTIRGISDKADGLKHDADASGTQELAASRAAAAAVAVLKEIDTGPRALRGVPARPLTRREPKFRVPWDAPARMLKRREPGAEPSAAEPAEPADGRRDGPHRPARTPAAAATALAVVLALAVLMLLLPGWLDNGDEAVSDGGTAGSAPSLPACSPDEVDETLRIAASIDLSKSLGRAAAEYGPRSSRGRCVEIVVDGVNSGVAMRALARGWSEEDGSRPDVWSPAGAEWLALARTKAEKAKESEALARLPKAPRSSIVTSPLTIAMPKPMAEALGWPEEQIGWAELAQWAQDPKRFWEKHEQTQWGALKLGKTNPEYSTSGLNATIGAFYARTGTSAELSDRAIDDADTQKFVRNIEKSVVHYGDTTLTFLANLRAADDAGGEDEALRYISAVTVEENAVVSYNLGYPCGAHSDQQGCGKTGRPKTPLVSFYPEDNTPVSDHPYIEFRGIGAAKSAVSRAFLDHLHEPGVFEEHFAPYGFRTHEGEPGSRVTQGNGALPEFTPTAYKAPRGPVLAHLQQVWTNLRRKANVLIVIDTSESMDDEVAGHGRTKMALLREAESALFGGFGDHDRVGLWRFSSDLALGGKEPYQPLVPIGPMREKPPGSDVARREKLAREVDGLEPDGATGLYRTVEAAVDTMRAQYDPSAINAIVLLTDGRNESASKKPTLEDLLSRIGDPSEKQVRVFTIAYGSKADEDDANGRTVLQNIAAATGARAYDAKRPETISEVLTSVISNF